MGAPVCYQVGQKPGYPEHAILVMKMKASLVGISP